MMKLLLAIGLMFVFTNLGFSLNDLTPAPDTLLGLALTLIISPWIARQLD